MAATVTIQIPPGTEVVLPASGSVSKSVGAALAITVANAAGESVAIDSAGAATKFTIGAVPVSIEDGQSGEIPLTVLTGGALNFQHETEHSLVSVTVAAGPAVAPFTDRQQQLRYVRP